MTALEPTVTNLELRESNEDGSVGAGLAHVAKGLFLLRVAELARDGHPRGAATIVHDAGSHGGRYLDLARALAGDGWAVALPDMRGSGGSEGERGHSTGIQEVVRDVEDVQGHLAYRLTTEPRVLIGHGLGAVYALAYALERPGNLAALVLAAPLLAPRFTLPEERKGLLARFVGPKVGPRTPGSIGFDPAALLSEPGAREERAADPLVHDVITVRAAQQAVHAAATYPPRVAELDLPVLVLQGSADRIADPELTARLCGANVKCLAYEDVRHDLFHEPGREAVVEDVRRWLDGAA